MSHYKWLRLHLKDFMVKCNIREDLIYVDGILSSSGDKCYGFEKMWRDNGIPFCHGIAIYLLTIFKPYSKECRNTDNGWVDPEKWVIDNYNHFKPFLPPEDNSSASTHAKSI